MERRNGRSAIYLVLLIAIVAAAIVRSGISTSLDGFTFDKAHHIGADHFDSWPTRLTNEPSLRARSIIIAII